MHTIMNYTFLKIVCMLCSLHDYDIHQGYMHFPLITYFMRIAKVHVHVIVKCAYTFLKCVCTHVVFWSCSWLVMSRRK